MKTITIRPIILQPVTADEIAMHWLLQRNHLLDLLVGR